MVSTNDVEHLKLVALDQDDLAIISAHLQDAVVRPRDLAYLPEDRRFALVARRFDWTCGEAEPRRRLAGLHFERVTRCRSKGVDRDRADAPLSLLAVTFEVRDAPSGVATLCFSGGASIELELECIEVQMKDLGPVWATAKRPSHALENT
ncbi:DUF2948 family protein [Enterovirga sp.]|jgi:hypothetical protein|uniref:DUF2948 family protein n=1 Tax=Enterovirga sp. TaxID=2026350 RepID=UPI00260CDC13|nr:DUF2948 family protein [Enterovirga sp.]MDB5590832.1 hypothetical protein [Enterovirga sp.]